MRGERSTHLATMTGQSPKHVSQAHKYSALAERVGHVTTGGGAAVLDKQVTDPLCYHSPGVAPEVMWPESSIVHR